MDCVIPQASVRRLAGSYQVEWFDVTNRETTVGEALAVKSASTVEFSSPFPPGPAVLYLRLAS